MKKIITVVAVAVLMGNSASAENMQKKVDMSGKGHQAGQHNKVSPFLIKKGLPHMTKLIKQNWDNPDLVLSKEQKTKLLAVRKEVMAIVKQLTPQITSLKKEIIEASLTGLDGSTLKEKVDNLAALEAEATVGHLNCIARTKAILSPEQIQMLLGVQ